MHFYFKFNAQALLNSTSWSLGTNVVGWGQLKRIKGAFQMSRLISAPYPVF